MSTSGTQPLIRMVPQPKQLGIQLFPHQLTSIYHMEKLEKNQLVDREVPPGESRTVTIQMQTQLGINSDPTGYGKTLSMIGLIARDKMPWDMDMPYIREQIKIESAGLVKTMTITRYTKLPATLVLVSPSILIQWEQESRRTNLRVGKVSSKRDVDEIDATEYDVVLVTTTMYNYLVRSYAQYAWKRLIFDEPGHERVPGMKRVQAGFYWFVTATPNAITVKHRNCRGSFMKEIIGDNWCDFEMQYRDMIIRNDEAFIKSSFSIPLSEHYHYQCFQPLSNTVAGLIHPTITTMIEAGNIEGAITALGGKKTKNIVELVHKKKLEELKEIEYKIRVYTTRKNQKQIDNWSRKRIRVNTQISELETRFEIMLEGPCFICHNELRDAVLDPACQNLFCGKCLFKWLKYKSNCPLCRADITLESLVYIRDNKGDSNRSPEDTQVLPLTKVDKILQLIQCSKNGKFLIFSTYNATFSPICRILAENKISYAMMKGSSKTRQNSIDGFKQGSIKVIFLNSDFNGAGINLQETTDLILYHKMNQTTCSQIIGRAERIGRTEPLRVHHLQVHI